MNLLNVANETCISNYSSQRKEMTLLISKVPLYGSKEFLSVVRSKRYAILSDVSYFSKKRLMSNAFPPKLSNRLSAKKNGHKLSIQLTSTISSNGVPITSIRSQHTSGISLPELLNDMLRPVQVHPIF